MVENVVGPILLNFEAFLARSECWTARLQIAAIPRDFVMCGEFVMRGDFALPTRSFLAVPHGGFVFEGLRIWSSDRTAQGTVLSRVQILARDGNEFGLLNRTFDSVRVSSLFSGSETLGLSASDASPDAVEDSLR